jgi:hypothetical protein
MVERVVDVWGGRDRKVSDLGKVWLFGKVVFEVDNRNLQRAVHKNHREG